MAPRGLLVLVPAVLATACAVTTADGERLAVGSDEFGDYVERVFREQNRVATELTFELEREDLSAARIDALETAERALLDSCAELNALAAARRDDEALGRLAAARAARTAPECERAARAAVELLAG